MTPKMELLELCNQAPSREELENRAFSVIMQLDEKTRTALLAPYKEKYRNEMG